MDALWDKERRARVLGYVRVCWWARKELKLFTYTKTCPRLVLIFFEANKSLLSQDQPQQLFQPTRNSTETVYLIGG